MSEKEAGVFQYASPTAATPAEFKTWAQGGTPITTCEIDGQGSTGKSEMRGMLLRAARYLPFDTDSINLHSSQEPPNWPEVAEQGCVTPYEYVRQNLDTLPPEDIIRYILQIRTGRWYGININGIPLNYPEDMLRDSNAILFQDRGNLSTFAYNGAGVLGIDPWEREGGAFHAHSAEGREIPFPTVLGVIIPDNLTHQIGRLQKRIELAHGEIVDKGDVPALQETLYLRYSSFLEWAYEWPGVYKIISAEANPDIFYPTGFSGLTGFTLLTYAIAVERGANHRIHTPPISFGTFLSLPQNIFRVETPNLITAYLYPGYLNMCFYLFSASLESRTWRNPTNSTDSPLELAFEQLLSNTINWGDIGLFARMQKGVIDLVVVATENRRICPIEDAIKITKDLCANNSIIPVTPATRKGQNFWRAYTAERRWINVAGIPIIADI